MCSLVAELGITSDKLLDKLGGCSLEQLAQGLPSAQSTDVHILAGETCLSKLSLGSANNEQHYSVLWEAFHQLSQSHATLYHHRHQQKLLRQNRSAQKSKKGCGVDKSLQQFENALLKPALVTQDTKDMLAALPSGWTVLQVTLGVGDTTGEGSKGRLLRAPAPRHTLHFARVTTGCQPSIVIQTVSGCEGSLLEEMERIKMQNKVLNKDFADNAAKYSAMREQLDARLKSVVAGLECSWLTVWRSLVTGSIPNVSHLTEAVKAAADSAGVTLSEGMKDKIMLLMCCPAVQLTPHEIRKKPPSAYYVFDCQLRCAIAITLGESVRSDKVQQLCAALLRIRETFTEARSAGRGPLILILDKNIVSLPWEALSCLKDQPVTRMPSLQSLHALYQLQKEQGSSSVLERGIDCCSGYYLLDPDSNLPRTQQRLSAAFAATEWPGMTAARPSHQQFKEALTQKDVFVYVGHGSGSQYLPGDLVEELNCRACALLYGCSSVRLQPRGHVPDPWGVLLNYLLANCPCVVGMLWEVTDKDTDLLTGIMLDNMEAARRGSLKGATDLPTIVAQSRHRCNRFLTASAIVVYGLPCSFHVSEAGDIS